MLLYYSLFLNTVNTMAQYELAKEFVEVSNEDHLTKGVFGCLQLLSTEALNELFSRTDASFSFSSPPKFTFHETIDRREPDVVIEDSQHLVVMVEAKRGDPTRTQQLIDEYDDLTENWDAETHCLLHITDDRFEPSQLQAIDEIPAQNLVWVSWRQLAAAALSIDTNRLQTADERVIEMLIEIMKADGVTPFNGFTHMTQFDSLSDQLEQAYNIRKQFYQDINSFRKDVESYLTEDIGYWRFFRRGISGGMTSGRKSFPTKNYQYMPRNLWFSYFPEEKSPGIANSKFKENCLFLDFNSRTGRIRAGYTMTTVPGDIKNDLFRKRLHEHKETVIELLQENGYTPHITSYSLSTKSDTIQEAREFLDIISDSAYDDSIYGRRFMITRVWESDEMPINEQENGLFDPAEVTQDIARELNNIHMLTYKEHPEIFYPELE